MLQLALCRRYKGRTDGKGLNSLEVRCVVGFFLLCHIKLDYDSALCSVRAARYNCSPLAEVGSVTTNKLFTC